MKRSIVIALAAFLCLTAGSAFSADTKAGAKKTARTGSKSRLAARIYKTLIPADGSLINNSKPVISAEYIDEGIGVSPTESKLYVDDKNVTSGAQLSSNKIAYTPSAPLQDGAHKIKLDVVDRAGNATSVFWSFTIHTRPPAIKITSHTQNQFVNQTPIVVSGTVAESKARIVVNGVNAVSEQGAFRAKVNLVEGSNTLTAVATDAFGNTGSDSVVVVVDTRPPMIEITSPTATSLINKRTVAVTGVTDKKTISVSVGTSKGASAPAALNAGSFTAKDVQLQEGVNTIIAKAVSQAGNVAAASVKITVDSVPPKVTVSLPKDLSVTNKKVITVKGTVDDPMAMVKVNGTPVQIIKGAFSLSSVNLSEGANSITATAVDRAGNQAKSTLVSVMLDTTPPASPTISPLPPVTRNPVIAVSGTSERGSQVEVYVNSSPKGKMKADEKGGFSLSLKLAEGNNAITAVAHDAIGNASVPSAVVNVFLDTKPPKVL